MLRFQIRQASLVAIILDFGLMCDKSELFSFTCLTFGTIRSFFPRPHPPCALPVLSVPSYPTLHFAVLRTDHG